MTVKPDLCSCGPMTVATGHCSCDGSSCDPSKCTNEHCCFHDPQFDEPELVELSESGILRTATQGKVDYLLVRDGPLFRRWATHISNWATRRGGKRNWMKASTMEDYERFRESAARHFEQWIEGLTDEDHAAAICFNINGAEYVKDRLYREGGGPC